MSESLTELRATDAMLDLIAQRRLDDPADLVLAELGLLATAVDLVPLPAVAPCWSSPTRTSARKGGWALSVTVALMVTSSGVAAAVSENPLAPLHYVSNKLSDFGPRTGGSVPGWDLHGSAPITAVRPVAAAGSNAVPHITVGAATGGRGSGSGAAPLSPPRSPTAPSSGGGGSGTGDGPGGHSPSSGPGTGNGQGGNSGTQGPGTGKPPPSNGGHRPDAGSGNSVGRSAPSQPSAPGVPGGANDPAADPYHAGNTGKVRHGSSEAAAENHCGSGGTAAPARTSGGCVATSGTTAIATAAEQSPARGASMSPTEDPASVPSSQASMPVAATTTPQKSSGAASLP